MRQGQKKEETKMEQGKQQTEGKRRGRGTMLWQWKDEEDLEVERTIGEHRE